MLWILLFVAVGGFAWWLFAPRRLQVIENIPALVDEELHAHDLVETVEDEEEVEPAARRLARKAGDIPPKGHGDSLTFDWPSDPQEPHAPGERPHQGPLNPQ
ncbi:MAG: hypothetical protein ACOY93_09205 [Bacillota bacterium]